MGIHPILLLIHHIHQAYAACANSIDLSFHLYFRYMVTGKIPSHIGSSLAGVCPSLVDCSPKINFIGILVQNLLPREQKVTF
jgi:hypothetical protein